MKGLHFMPLVGLAASAMLVMSCSGGAHADNRDTVELGYYPQARVSDEALVAALNDAAGAVPTVSTDNGWTDFGYYKASSRAKIMWYRDVDYSGAKYRGVHMISYRPRQTNLGSATISTVQDNNGYMLQSEGENLIPQTFWFKYEPIKWAVFDTDEQKNAKLLVARIALDAQEFNHTAVANDYDYTGSFIRTWLNDTFFNTSFSDAEKGKILTTAVDNSESQTSNFDIEHSNYGFETTNDKVFLLSFQEVMKYLPAEASRVRFSSDYAKCQGVFTDGMKSDSDLYDDKKITSDAEEEPDPEEAAAEEESSEEAVSGEVGSTEWWLRSPSPSKTTYNVWRIRSTGAFDLKMTNHTEYGIIPAIWVNN